MGDAMAVPAAPNDLLRLTQWLSPAFPLGAFAYSHGLEVTIADGRLNSAAALAQWLEDILRAGAGRSDGVVLSLTHRRVCADAELFDLAAALATSRERWEETLAQGTAFAKTTNAILGTAIPAGALPVVVGIQARGLRLGTSTVLALYLQSFLGNLVSVATRAVPLGQTEAQTVLDRRSPTIVEQADRLAHADLDDLGSAVPAADLASMIHETAEIRLFRS